MKTNKRIAISLFFVLLGLSFFKDNFSPDFLNSPSAHFLNPEYHVARFASLKSQGMFWFAAILMMSFSISLSCDLDGVLLIAFFGDSKRKTSTTVVCAECGVHAV